MEKIFVIGAGTMGAGIVQAFAQKGYEVIVRDIKDEFVDRGIAGINKGLTKLVSKGKITEEDKEAVLYIGGDGSQRSWLEALTVENGVKDQIIFLGALSRDDVSKWMNKCDCFVLPSRYETFGVVYIEALASGRPVIGALNGGAEDIINNLNGYLIPIDDIDILAEKMIEVYDNIESYDEEEIRIDCLKRFSPKVIVNKIISVYKEVLKDSVKFRMKK